MYQGEKKTREVLAQVVSGRKERERRWVTDMAI